MNSSSKKSAARITTGKKHQKTKTSPRNQRAKPLQETPPQTFSIQPWRGLVAFKSGKKRYLVRGQEVGGGYNITLEDNDMNELASHRLNNLRKELLDFFRYGSKTYMDISALPDEVGEALNSLLQS